MADRTLAGAFGKHSFQDLKGIVQELAEAQKRTENRLDSLTQKVGELAEAQKRTEKKVEELAEAQRRTETVIHGVLRDTRDLKKQLGGLSHAVGYGIEDRLMPFMKRFAQRNYGFQATSVKRCFVTLSDGNHAEVNLLIAGEKDGKPAYLMGECKAQPGRRSLKDFNALLMRLRDHFQCEVKGFIIGYVLTPQFNEDRARNFPHIDAFQTYEIEEIASDG